MRGDLAVVLEYAQGFATVELSTGAIEIVAEREVAPAESAKSAEDRQR